MYCYLLLVTVIHSLISKQVTCEDVPAQNVASTECFNVDAKNYVRECLNAGVVKLLLRGELFSGKDNFTSFDFPVSTKSSGTYNIKVEEAKINLFPPVHVLKEGEWKGNSTDFEINTDYYTGDFKQKYKFTATNDKGESYKGEIIVAISGYQVHLMKKFHLDENTKKYVVTDVEMEPISYGKMDYKVEGNIFEDLKSSTLKEAESKNLLTIHNSLGKTMKYYETVDPPNVKIERFISKNCKSSNRLTIQTLSDIGTFPLNIPRKIGIGNHTF